MKTIVSFSGLLVLCLAFLSCSQQRIPLGIVRNIPVYFQNNMLYGENIKSMEEKNAFIVATGLIDTTDESPTLKVAFISIDNQLMQLNFIETTKNKNGDEITDTYYANKYALLITHFRNTANDPKSVYTKAHIRIGNKNRYSEYEVFGKRGYL